MPTQQNATTQNNTHSETENFTMSEIQALSQQVEQLSGSAGNWANAGQWLTGLAAIAALLYFLTSTVALKRTNALANAQASLGKAKEDALQLELGKAKATAATAIEKTEQLRQGNLALQGQVATLEKQAAEAKTAQLQIEATVEQARAETAAAKEGTAKALAEQEKIRQENLQLSLKLEEERTNRLALEEDLAPRKLEQARSAVPLRRFNGTKVLLECPDDPECEDTARQIAWLVDSAGWEIIGFFDEPFPPRFPREQGILILDAGNAGRVLARQIKKNSGVEASTFPFRRETDGDLPKDVIRITVQPKPSKRLAEKQRKELLESLPPEARIAFESMERIAEDPLPGEVEDEVPVGEETVKLVGNRLLIPKNTWMTKQPAPVAPESSTTVDPSGQQKTDESQPANDQKSAEKDE